MGQVVLEAGAERGVLDGVNLALETLVLVEEDQTRALRAEMRMVINAEEHVVDHISLGSCTAKTTHYALLNSFGWMQYTLRACRSSKYLTSTQS